MGTTTGTLQERDIFGATFNVGEYVMVRCLVQSITPVAAGGNGGAADLVTCLVETPGNVGEKQGVTFVVSPVQCRRAGISSQA
jgi:hypothetical protein